MKLPSRYAKVQLERAGRAARRRALVLLLSGVTPIGPVPPDVCSKAPFQGTTPSQREWSLLAHDSDRFRARLWSGDGWLYLAHPEWATEGLQARGGEGWDSGKLVYSDSLDVRWSDIERLDCNRGTYSARGIILGTAAGIAAFVGLNACDGCGVGGWSVFAIPAGMLIGGIAGASQPIWRAVYCAAPPDAPAGPDRAP